MSCSETPSSAPLEEAVELRPAHQGEKTPRGLPRGSLQPSIIGPQPVGPKEAPETLKLWE